MTDPQKNFAPKNAAPAPPPAGATAAFTVKESRLIILIGTSRDRLRELRKTHLVEGTDWKQIERRVMLTEAAVDKIAAAHKLAPADLPREIRGLLTFPGHNPETLTLKVWRILTNRHVLEAYFPNTDPKLRRNIVRVRVTNTSNFVQHMELPARLILGHSDFYECTRPEPRSRGRW